MPYDVTNPEIYNDLFAKVEKLALESPIRALAVFENYDVPDGLPIWWKVRKAIFYAICCFMMKKFRSGGELLEWAQKEWTMANIKEKYWVSASHSRAIEALEHDFKEWTRLCATGKPRSADIKTVKTEYSQVG